MQQPLVTVITVTYNSAQFVRDTIESVLAQTYQPIEYIIADDCSRDNTWEIINEYRDPRIKAYRNEVNLGEYHNRNKAIDRAQGEYLMFIDGDDIIFPHGIGYFAEMMNLFPMAGMAIQKGYINNVLFPALLYPNEVLSNHYLGETDLLSSSFASNFFRTNVLKQVGKLSTDLISGDNDVRIKIAVKHPILLVAGWVSWPRETPGQAASRITQEVYLKELQDYTERIFKHPIDGVDSILINDIVNSVKRKFARFILKCISKGDFKKALLAKRKSKMKWKDVLKYSNYMYQSEDVMKSYSSTKPFKRGFLLKENFSNI